MKNYIKAYLISVVILDGVYFSFLASLYLKAIPYLPAGYIPTSFFLETLSTMLHITVHFVALMFIIILPFFKLVTKYPHASWVIVFANGFLLSFVIFLINEIGKGRVSITGFYINLQISAVFASIFASLFWWLNRRQKAKIKNIADDFS